MSVDLNKKTLRHFYCRDVLWQCFERISEDFDRGIDDLVNEAMRVFAREKGYLPSEAESRPQLPRVAAPKSPPPLAPPPLAPPPLPPPSRRGPPPGAPRASGSFRIPEPPPAPHEAVAAPPLYLVFQNQKYLVDKDQFIIGRGVKSSDLPIRDGNISRKHAAVVRRNGAYYMKDLGSTNGIEFEGGRVDNKKIEEGDVFSICDYQIRFTFR